jgi:hypothetical protein
VTGRVLTEESHFATPAGEHGDLRPIRRFDLREWRQQYPDESLSGSDHDILDFGYWYDGGDSSMEYEPPAEDWREEYRLSKVK